MANEREPTLQLTDDEIIKAQTKGRSVHRLVEAGEYNGMRVATEHSLVLFSTRDGKRGMLPPTLWAMGYGIQRGARFCVDGPFESTPHPCTNFKRLMREVKQWVSVCQECGSRKARPREVVPPLRNIRRSEGPYQRETEDSEYVTRYAAETAVKQHEAENVVEFIMRQAVLHFGPSRELLTDGAQNYRAR
ncbi:Hypothetical protein PHPALM_36495 [Phytophthora palmivora]|uniref:Uncharacterized protein n=1 Tax=Phytophthora palmivora TaxID=4796 RepID=A0A2P4WZT2_9STRA|nr:Hypothetical protein PHPALM_36495 [Phytophthora palmivora]